MCNANIRRDLWPQPPIDFDLYQFNGRRPKIANQIFSCQLGSCISGYQLVRSHVQSGNVGGTRVEGEGGACTRTLGQRQVASSGACRAQIFGKLRAASCDLFMTPGVNKRNICTGALDYDSPLVVVAALVARPGWRFR